ncbi:MAG: hypothetical protein QME46_11880 [Thermoanaerobacteraceae bacterium]|nr:hypothetical protein [Thermoanaerobacteraceae bacterium]
MLLKAEKVYTKFNEESIEIKIPKKLLLPLLQQVNRHYELLKCEKEIINNFAIHENISNTEMIMAKLFILMAEPYDKKEIKFETSIAEFLGIVGLSILQLFHAALENEDEVPHAKGVQGIS